MFDLGGPMFNEEYKNKLREMFEPCLTRADLKDQTEIVSLEWLMEMANPNPSETTNLGADKPGSVVSLADLGKDMKKRGLREPLVIAVGLSSGRARLEAGNHRVKVLLEMGFLHAPAVCWVGASHVGFEGNGIHSGREVRFWPQAKPLVALGVYDERYFVKPSLILPSAPIWSLDDGRATRSRVPAAVKSAAERKPRGSKAKDGDVGASSLSSIVGSG
jgi:hypothetical protein